MLRDIYYDLCCVICGHVEYPANQIAAAMNDAANHGQIEQQYHREQQRFAREGQRRYSIHVVEKMKLQRKLWRQRKGESMFDRKARD